MEDHQAAKNAWYQALLTVGTLFTVACSGYGIWVTFFYQGVITAVVPFAVAAILGALIALYGWIRKKPLVAAAGMMVQLFAPIGFAWLLSLIPTACGIALLILTFKQRKSA